MKIKDIKSALEVFKDACIKQSEATEQGDHKTANKNYHIIIRSVAFLRDENALTNLKEYLSSPFIGVRLWAAYYWLAINEQEGIQVLNEIIKSTGIHSLTAETIISEWKEGNLKF